MEFGNSQESCRKMVQDISVFYEACESYCGSNICPSIEPYYKHEIEQKCVRDCSPLKRDPNTHSCVSSCAENIFEKICFQYEFCHSTCDKCYKKNDRTKCSTCRSNLSLIYKDFGDEQIYG